MKRIYVSTADFRAPFDPVPFQGLGDPEGDPRWHHPAPPRQWPAGRSYWETALFRAPYRKGYYQDNSLFGLGADAGSMIVALQRAVGASPSGTWDAPTAAAVARKQQQLGLPPTGAPDITLLTALGLVTVQMPTVGGFGAGWRDVRTAFNQVPRWAYFTAAGALLWLGWKSYDRWKKAGRAPPP